MPDVGGLLYNFTALGRPLAGKSSSASSSRSSSITMTCFICRGVKVCKVWQLKIEDTVLFQGNGSCSRHKMIEGGYQVLPELYLTY